MKGGNHIREHHLLADKQVRIWCRKLVACWESPGERNRSKTDVKPELPVIMEIVVERCAILMLKACDRLWLR